MDDIRAHYNEIWLTTGVPPYLYSIQGALESLHLGAGNRVLDIACGNGALGRWLIEKYGCTMYGVDISPVALQACREVGYVTRLLDVDSDVFPFENEQFDVVLLSAVLEHVMNPGDLLKTAWGRLRQGGVVVVLTPNICWFVNRLLFLAGKWEHRLLGGTRGHISYLNKKQLTSVMSGAGFMDLDWSYSVVCVAGGSRICRRGLSGSLIRFFSNRRVRFWHSLLAFNFVVIGGKEAGRGESAEKTPPCSV